MYSQYDETYMYKKWSATKWVGNGNHEVSIGGTEAETCDLSLLQWLREVIKGCKRCLWRKNMAILVVIRGVKKQNCGELKL